MVLFQKFLNPQKLKGFDNYKYNCIDNSPISVYISHPFWNWFVNFYPLTLAPNVLTLSGALLVMFCYFFVVLIDWDLNSNSFNSEKNIPEWVWLICCICTFFAHLLDGTDGKQARRTGTSGPTGELFDHGLDSWSTIPFTLTFFSIFGQEKFSVPPFRLLTSLIAVQLVFIVTHWEKYITGVLFLSWGYDASQYGLSIFYLITYLFGHKIYHFYLFNTISFAQCFEIGVYVCCISSFIMSFYNIYKALYINRTAKPLNFYEFILPMISPVILFLTASFWALNSPNHIMKKSPRLFCWTMGTVFSNIAVHLIISQMTLTRAQTINKLLILYIIVAVLALNNVFGKTELQALQLSALFITVFHIYYGFCVVRQLCDHFKIKPFTIKKKNFK